MQHLDEQNEKKVNWFLYAALIVVAACVGLMIYWLNEPDDVLTIKGPVTVQPKHAQKHGAVILKLDFCKNVSVPGVVERRLVSDKTQIISAKMEDASPKGCHDNVEIGVGVPEQASPDTYHFEYTATYKVNPLSTVVEEFRSEDFVITDKQL